MGARRLKEGVPDPAPALPARPYDVEVFPVLDRSWPADGLGPIATLIAQLPDPTDLPKGALVVVHAGARPAGGLSRWLGFTRKNAHRAVRCTALLARGFKGIGAAVDPQTSEELTWGIAG
jgi:hypothetical protein